MTCSTFDYPYFDHLGHFSDMQHFSNMDKGRSFVRSGPLKPLEEKCISLQNTAGSE